MTDSISPITEDKLRIITLTDSQPVQIRESLWPVIARSEWYEGQHRYQANRKQWLIIRRHADGRIIVYGGMDTVWPGERDVRAGEFLWAGAALVPAIHRVSAALVATRDMPDLAAEVISDLPPVDVDAPPPKAWEPDVTVAMRIGDLQWIASLVDEAARVLVREARSPERIADAMAVKASIERLCDGHRSDRPAIVGMRAEGK